MGAQISEAIHPGNIAGAVRFEALLIAGKPRTEEGECSLAQACVGNRFVDLPGSAGGATNAEMGEKMGIFVTRIFQQATSGSAVHLIR
jgi:hypothetical protein